MTEGSYMMNWTLTNSDYRDDLEIAILHQNIIGQDNALKGQLTTEWGVMQMCHYKTVHPDKIPAHLLAMWWASEVAQQLLFFSLATWQYRNTYLHGRESQTQLIEDRREVVEQMAEWYERKHEFPRVDQANFTRTFLNWCSDMTKQIQLWLGKIVDIYEFNKTVTIQRFLISDE